MSWRAISGRLYLLMLLLLLLSVYRCTVLLLLVLVMLQLRVLLRRLLLLLWMVPIPALVRLRWLLLLRHHLAVMYRAVRVRQRRCRRLRWPQRRRILRQRRWILPRLRRQRWLLHAVGCVPVRLLPLLMMLLRVLLLLLLVLLLQLACAVLLLLLCTAMLLLLLQAQRKMLHPLCLRSRHLSRRSRRSRASRSSRRSWHSWHSLSSRPHGGRRSLSCLPRQPCLPILLRLSSRRRRRRRSRRLGLPNLLRRLGLGSGGIPSRCQSRLVQEPHHCMVPHLRRRFKRRDPGCSRASWI